MDAIENKNLEMVQLLVNYGANVHTGDNVRGGNM